MSPEPPTRALEGDGPPDGTDEPEPDIGVDGGDGSDGAGGPSDALRSGGDEALAADETPGGEPPGGEPPEGEPPEGTQSARARRRRSARRWIVEWVVIILVAVGVAFVVRTYVAQTYFVPSTSMYPTLKAGDRIVVNKLFGGISPGEIIVFKRPPAEHERCGGPLVPDLVKRVVGLPGQTVSARDGKVYITGKLQKDPWLPKAPTGKPLTSTTTTMTKPYKVPPGDYFVMGDNRVDSCDSRMWGPVKGSYVVGQVVLIIWPFSQFRFF